MSLVAGKFLMAECCTAGLEKEMATYSSTLTWRIPWTEESGRLQSMGSQRVRHGLVTKQQQLYSTGNYSQYLVTAYINGKETEKEYS